MFLRVVSMTEREIQELTKQAQVGPLRPSETLVRHMDGLPLIVRKIDLLSDSQVLDR